MKLKVRILSIAVIIISLVIVSGFGCKQSNPKKYMLNLEIWGLFDDQDAFTEIIENYKKINPNINKITYKKLILETYKQEVLDALASGTGPDIFLIQNNWLPSFANKVYPAPAQFLSERQFRDSFVDVVATDFLGSDGVYAVPLSVDSLGLYYNRDLFNAAGITAPPKNWDEFVEDSRRLTKLGANNQIEISGAALGTANNINRSTDILNLLMLQNQTEMVNMTTKQAIFDGVVQKNNINTIPGEEALNFYTQFANSNSSQYSWNSNMHYSVDAFSEGSLAMMINYPWYVDKIIEKSPKLNFAIAPVPQIYGNPPVNYANYWAYAVTKNRTLDITGIDPAQANLATNDIRIEEAWNFLKYLTIKPEQKVTIPPSQTFDPAISYLQKTNKVAARRDLVEMQKSNLRLGSFAEGNLIAKNWYQADTDAIAYLFAEMINNVNSGQVSISDTLKTTAVNVTQMMKK